VSVFIIAEAGVNHNGSKEKAFELIDVAIKAGANAIKFQTFSADKLTTRKAPKADYQKRNCGSTESQFDMLKKLELSYDTYRNLAKYCLDKNILFMSTAYDSDSLSFLINEVDLKTLKISSGEITNGPLLLDHARTGCNLILSTGMATLGEIEEALGVIAFGLNRQNKPSLVNFRAAYRSPLGQELLRKKVTLLHCTSEYPAPVKEINLNAMSAMRTTFGLNVGYSDHSEGITIPVASAALGATIIEKHFTLDKALPGPDHAASLEPTELHAMVKAIRVVEMAMGDGIKIPATSELRNRQIVRKSLVAAEEIIAGDKFTEKNLTVKRPGTGISPMEYWDVLDAECLETYRTGEIIS